MRGPSLWLALFAPAALATPLALLAGACSTSHGTTAAPGDAGDEATVDAAVPPPTPPPPSDASTTLDCPTDLQSDGVWGHLQCTGLYSDFASKTVVPAARPYVPALQLWADGATKQRWLYLPPGQKIDTSNVDEWVFPAGTKVWKEFQLEGRRVETRLYLKSADGKWHHTTYRWNADETDTTRNDVGAAVPRDGGSAVPPYQIPSGTDCSNCHDGRKDRLLGLEPVNLGMPGAQGITLASLVAEGLLTSPPPATTLAFPEDTSGKAAAALGWLHVSCGPCHNRSGDANAKNSNVRLLTLMSQLAGADAGADGGPVPVPSLDAYLTTVDHTTSVPIPDAGGATFYRIKKGDPGASIVSWLSGRRVGVTGTPNEKEQMPPIVTRVVDGVGHQKLDDWIVLLP